MDWLFLIWQIATYLLPLIVILYATYLYFSWPYSYFNDIGIPGPKPSVPLGNVKDVGKKCMQDVDLENIAEFGGTFGFFMGRNPNLMTTDTEILKEVYIKNFDKFCNRRTFYLRGVLRSSIFDTLGMSAFKRQRTILSKYFSSGKNKMSTPALNRTLDNLIVMLEEESKKDQPLEMKSISSLYTMDAICCTAFGVELNCIQNQDNRVYQEATGLFKVSKVTSVGFVLNLLLPIAAKLLDKFNVQMMDDAYLKNFAREIIKERQKSKEDSPDLIGTLVKARMEDDVAKGMTDDEIIANALLFLLAGFDTTASSLAFLIYNLTVNQEAQMKVYDEIQRICGDAKPTYDDIQNMPYLEMCVEETLRLYPIAVRVERMCTEDTVVKGIAIKEGAGVQLPIWYFHYNPDIWPDPETFIPERFTADKKKDLGTFDYCPFGVGPRHCIGMRLAVLELKLAIVRILQKFHLNKNEKTQIPLLMDPTTFSLQAKDGIWATLEIRE